MSVLVVAAHPDDEVLGAGATVARLTRAGVVVDMVILGEGITSRSDQRAQADPAEVARLHAVCTQVAGILGARSVRVHDLPDNRFDSLALLDVVKVVETELARTKPDTIYTHHPSDLNVDHRITFQAVLTATRTLAGQAVKHLYSFEVPSSTEWAFGRFEPAFRPNVFVDVSSTLETKLQAMACYEGELRQFPHPRSLESLRIIARRWGTVVGCGAAEAFELIRSIDHEEQGL